MALRLFYFCAILSVIFITSSCLQAQTAAKKRNKEWDFFIFTQKSTAVYCQSQPKYGNCKYVQNMTSLTIHGLWPSTCNRKVPRKCGAMCLDPTDIQMLVPQLVATWTNVHPDEGFYKFWEHEWLEHGTCATGISSMSTVYGYFSTVLSLFEDKHNYTNVLERHGIKPSQTKTYDVRTINSAFITEYGVEAILKCKGKKGRKQYLHEVQMCLQKDLSIRDCPPCKRKSTCAQNVPIVFLPSPP